MYPHDTRLNQKILLHDKTQTECTPQDNKFNQNVYHMTLIQPECIPHDTRLNQNVSLNYKTKTEYLHKTLNSTMTSGSTRMYSTRNQPEHKIDPITPYMTGLPGSIQHAVRYKIQSEHIPLCR